MVLYEEKSKVDRGEIDLKDSFQTNVRTKLFIFLWGKNIIFQGFLFVRNLTRQLNYWSIWSKLHFLRVTFFNFLLFISLIRSVHQRLQEQPCLRNWVLLLHQPHLKIMWWQAVFHDGQLDEAKHSVQVTRVFSLQGRSQQEQPMVNMISGGKN